MNQHNSKSSGLFSQLECMHLAVHIATSCFSVGSHSKAALLLLV